MKISLLPLLRISFMAGIILTFHAAFSFSSAQTPALDQLWKNYELHRDQRLNQESRSDIEQLLAHPDLEHFPFARIKAIVCWSDEIMKTENSGAWTALERLLQEAQSAQAPYRNLYLLCATELIRQNLGGYLFEPAPPGSPFENWNAAKTRDVSDSLSLAVLQNLDQCMSVKMTELNPAFKTNKKIPGPVLTAGDLLMIVNYLRDIKYMPTPDDVLFLSRDEAWMPGEAFTRADFTGLSPELSSFLKAQQTREAFHYNNGNWEAWLFAVMFRLARLGNYQEGESGEQIKKSIEEVLRMYSRLEGKKPAEALAWLLLWDGYRLSSEAANHQNPGQVHQLNALAMLRCEQGKNLKVSAKARQNFEYLQEGLLLPYLEIHHAAFIEPGKPFLLRTEYQNISHIYFRLLWQQGDFWKMGEKENEKELIEYLSTLPVKAEWDKQVPDSLHLAEVNVHLEGPPLKRGKYFLVACSDKQFSNKSKWIAVSLLSVNDYDLESVIQPDGSYKVFLFNSFTGTPLAGAQLHLWNHRNPEETPSPAPPETQKDPFQTDDFDWDDSQGSDYYLHANFQAGNDGWVHIPLPDSAARKSYTPEIVYGGDSILPGSGQEIQFIKPTVFLPVDSGSKIFTDRGIYKPGQEIHFNLLQWVFDPATYSLEAASGKKAELNFFRIPGHPIEARELILGEFGTAGGKIKIPENVLPGEYKLKAGDAAKSIRIENYRQNKIEIILTPLSDSACIANTKTVEFKIQYSSGLPVANATCNFESWIGKYGYESSPGVTNMVGHDGPSGTRQTDASGRVQIPLAFYQQPQVNVAEKPRSTRIIIHVVDAQGHSQTFSKTISLMPFSRQLQMPDESEWEGSNFENGFPVKLVDGNDRPVEGKVRVVVEKIKNDFILLQNNRFTPSAADFELIPGEEFRQKYPAEYFDSTSAQSSAKVQTEIFNQELVVEPGNEFLKIPGMDQWSQGLYRLTIIHKMNSGKTEQIQREFFFSQNHAQEMPGKTPFWHCQVSPKDIYAPGDTLWFQFGTSLPGGLVKFSFEKTGYGYSPGEWEELVPVTGGMKYNWKTVITDSMKGGGGLIVRFQHGPVFFVYTIQIKVAWGPPALAIRWDKFENKLTPSASATFEGILKDEKGNPVRGEVAIVVTELSLDQLVSNVWGGPWYATNHLPWDRETQLNWTFRRDDSGFHTKELTGKPDIYDYPAAGFLKNSFMSDYRTISLNGIWPDAVDFNNRFLSGLSDYFGWSGLQYHYSELPDSGWARWIHPSASKPDIQFSEKLIPWKTNNSAPTVKWQLQRSLGAPVQMSELPPEPAFREITVRRDFKETAFYSSSIRTDENGKFSFELPGPDYAGKYKLMVYAHNKEFAWVSFTDTLLCNKPVLLEPFLPRVLREGDLITIPVQIQNFTGQPVSGKLMYEWKNPATGQLLSMGSGAGTIQDVTIPAAGILQVEMTVKTPYQISFAELTVKILTPAGTDGWSQAIPVLPAKSKLSVSKAFWLEPGASDSLSRYEFGHLGDSAQITFMGSNNLRELAISALSYLATYPHDCAEQVYHKGFAWILGKKFPLQKTFDASIPPLASFDATNRSPWDESMAAANQRRQAWKKALATSEKSGATLWKAMKTFTGPNGGFTWFPGGYEDPYITAVILENNDKLLRTGPALPYGNTLDETLVDQSTAWLSAQLVEKVKAAEKENRKISEYWLNILRSRLAMKNKFPQREELNLYRKQLGRWRNTPGLSFDTEVNLIRCWQTSGFDREADSLLTLFRKRMVRTPGGVVKWVDAFQSKRWDESTEGTLQAMEAFLHRKDSATARSLVPFLISKMKNDHWDNTIVTAKVVLLLLNLFPSQMPANVTLEVSAMNKKESFSQPSGTEASFSPGNAGKADEQDIFVKNTGQNPCFGFVKVTGWVNEEDPAAFPKQITKEIRRVWLTKKTNEEDWKPLVPGQRLQKGDLLMSRLFIQMPQQVSYFHLFESRPAGCEPAEVFSGWKYSNSASWYNAIRDHGTDLYFPSIPEGTVMVEMQYKVAHKGFFLVPAAKGEAMYFPGGEVVSAPEKFIIRGQ